MAILCGSFGIQRCCPPGSVFLGVDPNPEQTWPESTLVGSPWILGRKGWLQIGLLVFMHGTCPFPSWIAFWDEVLAHRVSCVCRY